MTSQGHKLNCKQFNSNERKFIFHSFVKSREGHFRRAKEPHEAPKLQVTDPYMLHRAVVLAHWSCVGPALAFRCLKFTTKFFLGTLFMAGWPNYGSQAASGPPTSLSGPPNTWRILFKHRVSDCGQQCNSIGCRLSRKSHCIRPSNGQTLANPPLAPKSLPNPGLWYPPTFYGTVQLFLIVQCSWFGA